MSEHFDLIRRRYLRRRTFLKYSGLAAAATILPLGGVNASAGRGPDFQALTKRLEADHAVAPGYRAQVLMAWGDGLGGEPATSLPLSAEAQQRAFGFNNDFLAYTPLDGSQRGLLGINHEYPISHMMFAGYRDKQTGRDKLSDDEVRSEMAAMGHSVVEVVRKPEGWEVVKNSPYARRLHTHTAMAIDGPAAGHALMRTGQDPTGRRVLGTLGCCSGGKTPWGTVLIAEENVGDYFANDVNGNDLEQTDPAEIYRRWAEVDSRFDLAREPNELNRFGWVVEYDPRNPQSMPVKHTALGRFEHESAMVVAERGQPLVVYSGDDCVNQYIYRYVSTQRYGGPDSDTSGLMTDGTLYCARFDSNGRGRWLALRHGEGPLTAANGFPDQATVLVNARRASTLLGATPMDRPEGIAISPSGRVYVALTKNKEKTGPNPANPRAVNASGHILEILPPVRLGVVTHADNGFGWDILLQGGQSDLPGEAAGHYGELSEPGAWLANPDNLNFDVAGRLWIASDGMQDFGYSDGLWCTQTEGLARAAPRLFYCCPRGAELCSPEFTPDGTTLFASVQHPGAEDGSSFTNPSTRWPDFNPKLPPRPAIVAVTRTGGGLIGD